MTPSHVRRKGRNAYDPDTKVEDMNPYPKGHHHYQDFIDGWKEQEQIEKRAKAEREREPVCEKCGRVYCDHENKY
jgi:hypothetical protein